ncbi:hypothetical protein, partial [Halorhodospira sp. 9622]|uniref:hypothetical protein n=1 Tax=Halorhodospira sp. 9622 TaxID=2899136 RepID=UPI001EE84066
SGIAGCSEPTREPNGSVTIIDWEHSRVGPIFFDLAPIATHYDEAHSIYSNWKESAEEQPRPPELEARARRILTGIHLHEYEHRVYNIMRRSSPEHEVASFRVKTLNAAETILRAASPG